MADTISSEYKLKIQNGFADGDTRAINVPNPKDNITSSNITALNTLFKAGGTGKTFIVGDVAGADFSEIQYADKIQETKTVLDIY